MSGQFDPGVPLGHYRQHNAGVRLVCLGCLDHRELPLEAVIERLRVRGPRSATIPVFSRQILSWTFCSAGCLPGLCSLNNFGSARRDFRPKMGCSFASFALTMPSRRVSLPASPDISPVCDRGSIWSYSARTGVSNGNNHGAPANNFVDVIIVGPS